jgi:hypothetical protein
MRKIYLILLFVILYTANSQGQSTVSGTSTYRINVNGRVDGEGSDCGDSRTGGLQWIALIRKNDNNNTGYTVIQGNSAYPGSGRGVKNQNYNRNLDFTKTNPVQQIKWHTTRRSEHWLLGCEDTQEAWANKQINICQNISYDFKNGQNGLGLNQPGYTNVTVFPIISLDNTTESNRYIIDDGYLTISLPDNIDNQYYNWEFSVENATNFKSFPMTYNKQPTLRLRGMDFLSDSDMGKAVYIRVNMGSCADSNRISNTIDFTCKKSSPCIRSVTATDTICNGATNGRLKVQLDRPLLSGERLFVDYKNLTTLAIGNIPDPTIGSDNSFYLENLDAGNYEIQVSGSCNDVTTYSDGPDHKKTGKIESFPPLTYSTTVKTDITCFGDDNGSVTVTSSGGDSSYKLHWRKQGDSYTTTAFTSVTQTTLSNLEPGVYEYYVTDSHDCELRGQDGNIIIRTETLYQPAKGLDFTFLAPVEPSGYGRSDGSVTLEGDGGTPLAGNSYTVTWKNKQTEQAVAVVETDPSGAKFRTTARNIPAGAYTVEIKDANNCTFTDEITVSQPTELVITIENTQQILCNGDINGELTAHVNGGVLDPGQEYTCQWYKKNGSTYQSLDSYTDRIAANLGKGDYKVEVKDKSRIVNTQKKEFSLDEPPVLTATLVKQDVTCFGGNNGDIRIEVSGGAGDYKLYYKLKDDTDYNAPLSPQGNTFILNNLTANEYRIYITDGNNCTASISGESLAFVTISQPAQALEITQTQIIPVSGFGRSDGSITIKVKGGTPNPSAPLYNVMWKNALGTTVASEESVGTDNIFTSKIENLPQEIYTVEIKDKNYANVANACYVTSTFTIIQPEELTLQLENTNGVYCHGEETGEIVAHARGGVSGSFSNMPYNYKWYRVTNGNTTLIPNQSDSILSNRPAGFYKVRIEDASSPANTIESAEFEIAQPTLLTTVLTTRNIFCHGLNDGFIKIEVSGGVGGYRLFCKKDTEAEYREYPINTDNTTFLINNLYSGTYSVYIQDANGCYAQINSEDTYEITLTQPNAPLAILSMEKTDASGFGRSDGNIKITVEGGTPNTDNTYSVIWTNEAGQILQATGSIENSKYVSLLNNIPKGSYAAEVKDGNYAGAYPEANSSCIVREFYAISEPDELLAEIEETHFISCNGMSDGQLAIHATGGIRNPVTGRLPYVYKWYKEEPVAGYTLLANEQDSIISNISTGNYKVEIEDYSRIINTVSVDYNLEQPELLQATATETNITCGQTATISVSVTGGTDPYAYLWSTGDQTASINNVTHGRYFVFITDSRGCETTAIAKVSTPADLQSTAIKTNPICYGANNGSIELQVAGGTAPYTYNWNTGATDKDLNNLKAGLYTVIISDKDGCTYTDNFILSNPESLTVYLGEDRTLCNGQSLTLAPAVIDPETKFSWTGPDSFKAVSSEITIDKAGVYKLTITDSKGCQATDEINISVKNIDISSEIFVATEVFAGDTIVIANISNPNPDRMEWLIEDSDSLKIVEVDEHYARVLFSGKGYYKIGFRAHKGDCFQEIFKTITVIDRDGTWADSFGESIIEKYHVSPNPNDGNFNVQITLNKTSAIRLRIIDMGTGNTVSDRKYAGEKEYDISYNKSIVQGVYVIVLETASGYMNLKMIVR